MKKQLIFFVLILLFSSCAQVYFASPQPIKGTTIKSFIPDVRGEYSDSLINIKIEKNEIVISGEYFQTTSKNPVTNEVLVKYSQDYYLACFKDSIYYSVFMGKFYDNKLAIYMLNADSYSIRNLKKIVGVEKINEEDDCYLINPSKKELDDIINYGMFEVVHVLERK